MKNGQLLVNGVAITIKGVNRQEHNAVHGRTLSIGEMVKDVKMMKQFNINAVRTSHYQTIRIGISSAISMVSTWWARQTSNVMVFWIQNISSWQTEKTGILLSTIACTA